MPDRPGRSEFGCAVAGDDARRVRVAADPRTACDTLQALASDCLVVVRAAVALNHATPPSAHAILADDADERVRALLARKLAALLPSSDDSVRDRYRDRALRILATLVEDEATRVRAAIADVLKEMPQAPREMILRLARDTAVQVSEPVIRLSPLLTPDDLLALLASPPTAGAATAIACRPNLAPEVADAVAASADDGAISALLRNRSAAIREATLDGLIARAAAVDLWHEPLVARPALSARAARALSEIVTTSLLQVLVSRGDLDPVVVAELRHRLERRVALCSGAEASGAPERGQDAYAHARALQERGRLTGGVVREAARRGDTAACAAFLAAAANVPLSVVYRAAELRSAKGIVSLAWAAKFSMRIASILQTVLANIPPDALLAENQTGGYPLAPEEMRWQIELLTETADALR